MGKGLRPKGPAQGCPCAAPVGSGSCSHTRGRCQLLPAAPSHSVQETTEFWPPAASCCTATLTQLSATTLQAPHSPTGSEPGQRAHGAAAPHGWPWAAAAPPQQPLAEKSSFIAPCLHPAPSALTGTSWRAAGPSAGSCRGAAPLPASWESQLQDSADDCEVSYESVAALRAVLARIW